MRRLWLLSLVLLTAVCFSASDAEDKAPIKCYYSRNSGLGGIRSCPPGFHCMINVTSATTTTGVRSIVGRFCDSGEYMYVDTSPHCDGKFPWSFPGHYCRCNTSLCNNMIGEEFKCYQGAEGDCDFINSIREVDNSRMTEVTAATPIQVVCGDTRGYTKSVSDGNCYTDTFSAQGKTCTRYGCDSYTTNGWEEVPGNKNNFYYPLGYGTDEENDTMTMTKVSCTGSLCNKPAKVCTAGGTGLTLSLVGLMAAVVAAYST